MTLDQMMAWNGKMPMEEYEKLLKKIDSKKKALKRACDAVYSEEDSLDVLADERGSERWLKHEAKHLEALAKADKLMKELKSLEETLSSTTYKISDKPCNNRASSIEFSR